MQLTDKHREYWHKNLVITAILMVVWFVATFVEGWYARELNGVTFLDMPWLLLPDHPAVLSYARPEQANMEFQRFYALGIDAYRIAQWLANPRDDFAPLDGVTGTISMDRERRLQREPVAAQFAQGEVRVLFEE